MGYINTTFLGKEYSIPQDVLSYIDLLIFTETMQKQLATSFVRMLNKKIQQGDTGLLSDEDLSSEIERQVGKFIAKLCDNGIFTRTIRDYLDNNKGYQYVSDVNKSALEAIKSFLLDRLSSMQEGLEEAGQKADSRVTGMGFSILSGSFINHAIYAAMEASTLSKQEKEADAVWRKETRELTSRLETEYNKKCADYITSKYIPNMEAAFTVLAYELLDRYISDLIEHNKFDRSALNFVNIGRSNDLLKNLTLSENKKAILANAFTSCPYNIAVYMQAMKYDLLDYESFQTANLFRHGSTIISFLEENLGGSAKSEKRQLNFKNAELLSLYSGRSLREITAYVADFIVDGYAQTIAALSDTAPCYTIMNKVEERAILAGDSISKQKAAWLVDPLAPAVLWDKLTSEYGHADLFDRLLNLLPDRPELNSKQEYDTFLKNKLFTILEVIREERVAAIFAQRQEDARISAEEAEIARIAAEKRKKSIKYGAIIGSVAIIFIVAISLLTSYFSTVSNIDDYIASQQYEHAFDAVNNSNLSTKKKQEYKDVLIPLMQKHTIKDLEKYQIINADHYDVFLEDNEIVVRDENGEGLLYCNGRGKILEDIIYTNGYILFVEAFDSWGYDVKYISIENGGETHIDTFDEFDRLVKLHDGRILIDSTNSDDLFVIFDPYTLSTETATNSSAVAESIGVVYDTNNYGFSPNEGDHNSSIDFSSCDVGDIFQFGRYEQDGRTANGKEAIDWIVLEVKDGKALVVTEYAIEARSYNHGDKYSQDVSWDECSLRDWLNEVFLISAFNQTESALISITETSDKVFLLNIDMAKQYFSSDSDRQCQVTTYAKENGASEIDDNCWWWLQSTESKATVVGYKGDICDYGNYVHIDSDEYAVRPAMWIEVDKPNKTDEPDAAYNDPITNHTPGMFLDYQLGDPVLPDYISE